MGRNNGGRTQTGFTLVEILLVIAILMGMSVLEMRRDAAKAKELMAAAVGKQLAMVSYAVEQYMVIHSSTLQARNDANCTWNVNLCDLKLKEALIDNGLLPADFDPVKPVKFGGTYVARVLAMDPPLPTRADDICPRANPPPIGCPVPYVAGGGAGTGPVPAWQRSLRGIVFTSMPWTTGYAGVGDIERGLLGSAAKEAGPLAGVTQANGAVGLYAGWTVGAEFGGGLSDGQLAYVTGTQTNLWSQFLRRDGSKPMTGNLNMGNKNVLNMRDLFLNGPPTNPRNKNLSSLLPHWVFQGVVAAKDGAIVSFPTCLNGGVPRIKLLMQLMKGTHASFYNDDGSVLTASSQTAADAALASRKALHTMRSVAEEDTVNRQWTVRFQDMFDQHDQPGIDPTTGLASTGESTVARGEGLGELYCEYPDQ